MKEQNNELFFVQIKEPTELRRNILEALKEIVEALKRFENFKHIRHEKLESIRRLRVLLKDANKMVGSLKLRLPQTNLRATVIKESPKQPAKSRHKKKKKGKLSESHPKTTPKREMTELEKLETELTAIESKLRNL